MQRTKIDKFFEKIPPSFTWILILFPFIGSIFAPVATAYAIIVFNTFFLYKSASSVVFFMISYNRIEKAKTINWNKRLDELKDIEGTIERLEDTIKSIKIAASSPIKVQSKSLPRFLFPLILRIERKKVVNELQKEINLLDLVKKRGSLTKPEELNHVIMIPHWKEPYSVLEDTMTALSKSTFPTKQISVILAAEARDPEGVSKSEMLKKQFKDTFGNIWISNHELQEDEIIGKSSNMAWAGKMAKEKIEKLGWDLKKTTITSCDADSIIPPRYFSYMSYEYLTQENAEYKFYISAILFYANIWRLPFYARVKNSVNSLYNVSQLCRTDKLKPFSTYTTSFWLIDQIGYWTPWVTPEDFHIFFKSLFHFPEKVAPVALYNTIYSDAAEGDTHLDTIKNNYFQERRWSWGVSDDGWLVKQMIKLATQGRLNLRTVYRATHVIFDHTVGIATTVIIVLGGNLPTLLNEEFSETVFGSNLASGSAAIIRTTIVFFIFLIVFDNIYLKPPKPDNKRPTLLNRILSLLEWLVLPIVNFTIVFLPGVEAHTRLLFGKYLEYYLTKKKE